MTSTAATSRPCRSTKSAVTGSIIATASSRPVQPASLERPPRPGRTSLRVQFPTPPPDPDIRTLRRPADRQQRGGADEGSIRLGKAGLHPSQQFRNPEVVDPLPSPDGRSNHEAACRLSLRLPMSVCDHSMRAYRISGRARLARLGTRDGRRRTVASTTLMMEAKLRFTSDRGDNGRAGTYLGLSVPDVDDPVIRFILFDAQLEIVCRKAMRVIS